jgi:Leucine-rich repeat (LRR) protein
MEVRMRIKIFVILFPLTVCFISNFMYGAIPAQERAALIALYNSTNGDNWYNNSGWKTPPLHIDGFAMPGTERNWYGVTLSGDNVHWIELGENNLSGNIPSQLGNLSNLQNLYLLLNQLSGTIPPELGNLSNLHELYLSFNQLSGTIPPKLGNLSNLKFLALGVNQLGGTIPPELGNLSNLRFLGLEVGQLSGTIPTVLSNLSNLYSLSLSRNQLSGTIPYQLGNLSNLTYLYLDNNQLSGAIPPELGNLSKLQDLWLFDNQLSGDIPSELGNLSNLQYFLLNNNQLSGAIPLELGNINNLRRIYLDNNHLDSGIPSELGNLSNLEWLFLGHNHLSGGIPSQFGNLSKLERLNLSGNQLSGGIPSSFINLTNIYDLDVGYNCLSATGSELIAWLNSYDPDWEATQCLEKAPPFGYFETPIHGSTVSSSIPITGWALDDYGMDSVKIYCEQENNLVFIGDAIFVEGARPDVEAAYPGYPENDRAGWGYMMLTNFLPNGGNGTYVLHAIATDRYGRTTTLGTKTIIVDNAHAVKPFGAIDTPIQGGKASGSSFINWGWALTPSPNKIPNDGSSINVWIDGVNIGHPTYNIYRSDIASLFPDYANSNGAVGYFYLNTRKYPDGLHTIQWTAVDNAGNIDGIGSRYFTVENPFGSSATAAVNPLPDSGSHIDKTPGRSRHDENTGELLAVKADIPGFTIKELALMPEEKGMNDLIIKELERVEIKLGENYSEILGYLLCNNELKKLPIGSTLDSKSGTFSWSAGPGFLGRYSLVFVLMDFNGQSVKKSIEIEIVPKFNGLQ